MKDTIINVLTNEAIAVEISQQEQERREADAAKIREEASKPQPPSEIDNLKSRQADIIFAMVMNNLM